VGVEKEMAMGKLSTCLAAIALSFSLTALADAGDSTAAPASQAAPAPASEPQAQPTPEVSANATPAGPAIPPPERPFVFTTDPSLPEPGHVIVSAGLGNVTKTGEERPSGPGSTLIPTAGVEVGALSRMSVYLDTGFVFWAGAANTSPVTLDTGVRVLLTNPTSQSFHLILQPSYGLDYNGNSTVLLNSTFAYNYSFFRAVASMTISHTFQSDADPFDLEATVGAVAKVSLGASAGNLLFGVEGVVTDLEEIATAGAEGGSSAYAGPTVGWEWNHRFQISFGPAYGGGPNYYQGFVFRGAASAHF
jgi:hypothetical protein